MSTDGPVVPASLADITAPWLSEVLGQPVDGISVVPLTGTEAGFLGDVARILIEPPTDEIASLIVKLPPADPGGRHVGAMLNVWAREQAFYHEVAPASPGARVPRCHLAAGDPEHDRWILVLEDCPSEPLVPATGASRAQADAAIDALVGLHAAWWEADTRYSWMPGMDTSGFGGLAPLWTAAVPRFLERYGHLLPDGTDRWLGLAPEWLPDWAARAATEPLTIAHADYRLDNLRYHDGAMTMIDWQTALRGPGPMDLASFVATACTIPDRRRWEPELLERYEVGLRAGGVDVDRGWLERSYDENLVWWMGQFANNLANLAPADPEAQAALDTTVERTFAAAADRDVGRLLVA
ncbi:MAG: aminoglycoside phosphotransferase family protein [Actinomycetota bacterium]